MTYNIDFLIAAMVILLLVLWYFLGQKRAEDLNNQVFLFFAIIGILDVVGLRNLPVIIIFLFQIVIVKLLQCLQQRSFICFRHCCRLR